MKQRTDRRRTGNEAVNPLEDNGRGEFARERRKQRDRRLENLDDAERQTLLSEMPGVLPDRRP